MRKASSCERPPGANSWQSLINVLERGREYEAVLASQASLQAMAAGKPIAGKHVNTSANTSTN